MDHMYYDYYYTDEVYDESILFDVPCHDLIESFKYHEAIACITEHFDDEEFGYCFGLINNCYARLNELDSFFELCIEKISEKFESYKIVETISVFLYVNFSKLFGKKGVSKRLTKHLLKSNLPAEKKYYILSNVWIFELPSKIVIPYYEKLHELNPQNVEPIKILGIIHNRLKNYNTSIKWYKKILSTEPNNIETVLDIANSYNRLENRRMQLKYLMIAEKLNLDSNNISLLLDIASTYGKQKDRRMQLKYIEKATDISPDDFSVKLSMRNYNSDDPKREKVESSHEVYRRKIVVLLNSGEKLLENDDYKASIIKFTEAIEMSNKYKTAFWDLLEKALYLRGFAKISLGEFNSGMSDIRLYMGKDKLNISIESTKILSAGIELYHQEKFDEAINHLSVATQFEEIKGEAFLVRGKTYLKIDKKNEAYTDLQEAYRLGWLGALMIMKNNELLSNTTT